MRYLYTMKLSITPDIVNEVIVIANDYNIPRLLQMCEKFYVDHIQVEISTWKTNFQISNVISVYFSAKEYECSQLSEYCLWYMVKNFKQVSKEPEWGKIPKDIQVKIEAEHWEPYDHEQKKGKNCLIQ